MSKLTIIERGTNSPLSVYQGSEFLTLSANITGGSMSIHLRPVEARELATGLMKVAGRMVKVDPTPPDPPSLDARNIEYWDRREM